MSFNGGCNCGCAGNGDVINIPQPLQQGDTFTLNFQYKEDDVAMPLPSGYALVIGLWDSMGELIASGRTDDGTIVQTGTPSIYGMDITHEQSVMMIGRVILEVTIIGANGEVVDNASEVVAIDFETRRNNRIL